MKLYRFCSHDELSKLLRGEEIYNYTDHYHEGHGGSISFGFCFTQDDPRDAWKYLRGIVTPGVCLEFDIPEEHLTKSRGKYMDKAEETAEGVRLSSFYCDEWCTTCLKPKWLTHVIPLESFVSREELQSVRYYHTHKAEIMKRVKYASAH